MVSKRDEGIFENLYMFLAKRAAYLPNILVIIIIYSRLNRKYQSNRLLKDAVLDKMNWYKLFQSTKTSICIQILEIKNLISNNYK